MSNILDQLGKLGSEKPDPQAPKMELPKKPSGPGAKPSAYVPVEVVNPGSSETVGAFLAYVMNPELCSDADREMAARALMNATGRKLVVDKREILKQVGAFVGATSPSLMIAKAFFYPKTGAMYLNLVPGLLLGTSLVMFGLTMHYRRKPDITLVLLCALIGTIFTIGILSGV